MFQSICALLLAAVATVETMSLVQWSHSLDPSTFQRNATYLAQAGPPERL